MAAQADLIDQIEMKSVECLNANSDHGVENALKQNFLQGYREDDGLYLESDADEQLLIHIPFSTAVKLSSLVIKSTHGDKAPKKVRLFINKPTLGFGDASDLASVQDFELSEQELTGNPVQLKFVKFQKVNTLTIFLESNQGDEETTIVQRIKLTGSSGETFNVNEIKKIDEDNH